MKAIIFYKSYLGSTKKYAHWLQEKTQAELFTYNQADNKRLDEAQIIVIMSGTYAGQMPLINFLKKHWDKIKEKNIVVIAIGAIPAEAPESQESYKLIPSSIQEKIMYYKLPGRLFKTNQDRVIPENLNPIVEKINSIK